MSLQYSEKIKCYETGDDISLVSRQILLLTPFYCVKCLSDERILTLQFCEISTS